MKAQHRRDKKDKGHWGAFQRVDLSFMVFPYASTEQSNLQEDARKSANKSLGRGLETEQWLPGQRGRRAPTEG